MINTNIRHFVLCLLMLVPCVIEAQTDRDFIRQGNKAYRLKNFPQAEVQYRKALSKNNGNPQALYNLGCALMMQNKASEAVKFYQKASEVETNKLRKAKIYHNIGIICQSGKMYGDAIKAYSESLRNNPHDNETRYNLALCKKLQKNGKNNKQQQQQNMLNNVHSRLICLIMPLVMFKQFQMLWQRILLLHSTTNYSHLLNFIHVPTLKKKHLKKKLNITQ